MVWGMMCYLGDAVARMVGMTMMTGAAHSSIDICNWWAQVAAGVLCSQGCWANSCCTTLFLFTIISGREWESELYPSAELLVQLR